MNTILRSPYAKALIVLVLAFATTAANAQRSAEERRARQQQSKGATQAQVERYPNATRQPEGDMKASSRMGQRIQRMIDGYNKQDFEAVEKNAREIISADNASTYDKALASRLLGATQMEIEPKEALASFQQALAFNSLNNNDHYEVMWYVAQLQAQEDQMAEALATLDKLMSETQTAKREHVGFKGVVLYQMERHQEAIDALNAAFATEETPDPNETPEQQQQRAQREQQWQQLLMASYADSGQGAQAITLSEQIAASKPDDVQAQLNLAGLYIQNDQDAKAIEVYERLRAAGKLTEERDYRNLVAMYLGQDNGEPKAIEIINQGLENKILQPSHELYSLLGQAYYFSEQMAPAVEAYRKAASLAPDGEASLNLAKVLWAEGRIPEAKQAAQQALDKGIKAPQEAQNILKL